MMTDRLKKILVSALAVLAAAALIAGGIAAYMLLSPKSQPLPNDDVPPSEPSTFTLGWVSDPQWYSFKYFDILTAQNDWIVQNFERLNMKYIVHTGDFVDQPHARDQWEFVSGEYAKWDSAGIPYGVLAGNHDVDGKDYTEFQQYFGTARYAQNSWYGASYDNNRGHYDLMTIHGVKFIFVYLGYGDHTKDDVAWLNSVLQENNDCIAMLSFHDYLIVSGERSTAGENLFRNVVLQNPNVRMVFCGHNYNATRRVDEIDDNGDGVADRTVYQLMANYQNLTNGGNGFFRLMECDVEAGTISSRTYSPYLDTYNAYENSESVRDEYGYQDEFTIPFDFSTPLPKSDDDPKSGTVVVNSRVGFAATDRTAAFTVPIQYLNIAEHGAVFSNAGWYDRSFSLTATDAFAAVEELNYVVLTYSLQDGYRVESVVKGASLDEEDMVPIPRDGAVIVLASDALDSRSQPVNVEAIQIGQVVTLNQIYGHAAPTTSSSAITLTFPWGEAYTVNGTNRIVVSDQWIVIDTLKGDSAADTGDTHKWNMLFAFAPVPGGRQEYTIVDVSTASGTDKDLPIPQGGFVLSINTATGKSSLRASMREWFVVGTTVTLEGYDPV